MLFCQQFGNFLPNLVAFSGGTCGLGVFGLQNAKGLPQFRNNDIQADRRDFLETLFSGWKQLRDEGLNLDVKKQTKRT